MKPFSLNIRGRLECFEAPAVMGIINVTPDSFYGSSRVSKADEVVRRVERMMADGARIIDIGGCSTRPGFVEPSVEEESGRVVGAIEAVRRAYPDVIISVDTYRAEVARRALDAGADIINDVSGLSERSAMIELLQRSHAPYVLTAAQTVESARADVAVMQALQADLRELSLCGVADVIIDPGFGFGKTLDQNYQLLNALDHLDALDAPVLVGLSRKSMIRRALGVNIDEALNATTALQMVALERGAAILRAHDVKEAAEAVSLYCKLNANNHSHNSLWTHSA